MTKITAYAWASGLDKHYPTGLYPLSLAKKIESGI